MQLKLDHRNLHFYFIFQLVDCATKYYTKSVAIDNFVNLQEALNAELSKVEASLDQKSSELEIAKIDRKSVV